MKVLIIDQSFNKDYFNNIAPHPMQSFEWGQARLGMGIDVLRLGEFSGKDLKAIYQITFHPIPKTPFTIGYLPRSVSPPQDVITVIAREASIRNSIFVKIEPYERKNSKFKVRNSNLISSPHPLFPDWTQIVNLEKTENELLQSMKHKTRYNIKLATRKGVMVKEMTGDVGFNIFSKLYFDTCRRQGYHGHNKDYHRIIFESLRQKIAHIFVAFYHDEPLAAYEIFIFNEVGYYPYGGSSLRHRNLMASNLLMWEAIRFAKGRGAKWFDMWGSLSPDDLFESTNASPWVGFSRFKEGFGGEFVEFIGSFDLVLDRPLYLLYNTVQKFRKILLRL